jgi:hypothetical protein
MSRTIHRKSDRRLPDTLEPGDIVNDRIDPAPNIPRMLGNRKKKADQELEKALRAIVLKLQTL